MEKLRVDKEYRAKESRWKKFDKFKPLLFWGTSIICIIFAMYVWIFESSDSLLSALYSALFFVPVIIASLLYYKKSVYVAAFFGLYDLFLIFTYTGALDYIAVLRLLIFIAAAYSFGVIAETGNNLQTMQKKLADMNYRLNGIIESYPDATLIVDNSGRIGAWNKAIERMTGIAAADAIGKSWSEFSLQTFGKEMISPIELLDTPEEELRRVYEGTGNGERAEAMIDVKITGEDRLLFVTASRLYDAGNAVVGAIGSLRDVTDFRHMEVEIEKLSRAVQQSPSAVIIMDTSCNIEYVNPKFMDLTGYFADDVVGRNITTVDIHENIEDFTEMVETVKAGLNWHGEFSGIRKNTDRYWVLASVSPLKSDDGTITHLICIEEDITPRKIADDRIKNSLKEKEVLLKEVHHRVKNNLQIISSMLNLQSEYLTNDNAREAFRESRDRIKSMALIHEKLYQSNNLSLIDFGEYSNSLATSLIKSYCIVPGLVEIRTCVEDISLDIDTAIPCGLILNELISNALKHAFPDGRKGNISVEMRREDKNFCLIVSDDGIGMPEAVEIGTTSTLGLELVHTLVDQMEGSIDIRREPGTTFTIVFKDNAGRQKK